MGTVLCRNLKLSIEVEDVPDGERLVLKLADDLAMVDIEVCYPVGKNTINRPYHRKEAMVIAMRRLISAAIDQHLISTSRGVSIPLSSTMEERGPTTSTTELGV